MGITLPLEHPEIPEEWQIDNDFYSHRPMLYRAIMNTSHTSFLEFGTGQGSTPLLKKIYQEVFPEKDLISYESNDFWYECLSHGYETVHAIPIQAKQLHNHCIVLTDDYLQWSSWKGSIVFVDCAPGELRKHLVEKHRDNAKIIIVHDTEPGAEYVYGLSEVLNSFTYRCDLIFEGNPQTTVVSDLYDFADWKTIINDRIKFI